MTFHRALGAAVLALGVAAPAQAAVDQSIVYTVRATAGGGALDATCTFQADRWTLDYGPTHVTAYAATTGVASNTSVRCTAYTYGSLSVDAWSWQSGNVATIVNERHGTIGTRSLTFCVEAGTQYVVDHGYIARNCVTR